MHETETQITWPSKLKIGAKSKKGMYIMVISFTDTVFKVLLLVVQNCKLMELCDYLYVDFMLFRI